VDTIKAICRRRSGNSECLQRQRARGRECQAARDLDNEANRSGMSLSRHRIGAKQYRALGW
jgi:hypothetical protein